MNPFMPDRGEVIDVRHVPYPPQGNTLISSQGTPPDFLEQPVAKDWTNDTMPTHHISVDWHPADDTARLAGMALGIDFLTGDPGYENFRPGPGDTDSGPGWM